MHPFTGGCHFPRGCEGFAGACARCPQARTEVSKVSVERLHRQKAQALISAPTVFLAAPSEWILRAAGRSTIARHLPGEVVSNFFDPDVFTVLDRTSCRRSLGLPEHGLLALFVAGNVENERKGYRWFRELCLRQPQSSPWQFVVIGGGDLVVEDPRIVRLGTLPDPRLMALAYNACNAFLSTAEEDNLPSTLAEAQLCGTPVVAFRVGGQPEMITEGRTGFLVEPGSLGGLQSGLDWVAAELPAQDTVRALAWGRWNPSDVIDKWIRLYQGEQSSHR